MRYAAPQHVKKKKFRRTGRHTTPSQTVKMAQQAGKAAPAVAVIGALAAGPHVYDDLTAPFQAAGQQAKARPAKPGGLDAADASQAAAGAGQRGAAAAGELVLAQLRSYRPKHIKLADTSSEKAAAGRHHRAAATGHRHTAAPRCTGDGGMLPANYARIVRFLLAHGYTPMAAAGIAGNVYQESKGDPESVGSGGGGLIGWTPLPAGMVTGNPAADLKTQLADILTYNRGWAEYLPALNAAGSPAQAADIYVTDFERAGIPAAANREAAANAVAAACKL